MADLKSIQVNGNLKTKQLQITPESENISSPLAPNSPFLVKETDTGKGVAINPYTIRVGYIDEEDTLAEDYLTIGYPFITYSSGRGTVFTKKLDFSSTLADGSESYDITLKLPDVSGTLALESDMPLRHGNADGAIETNNFTYDNNEFTGTYASGINAIALGGKRFDKVSDSNRTPTSAEGNQSFAVGGSVHAYGDFSVAMSKDTNAYQKSSFVAGGGSQAGMTEDEFNAYFWDSTTASALHGGQGKDLDGNILSNEGETYAKSYSFGVAFGNTCKALGKNSFAHGFFTQAQGMNAVALNKDSRATGDSSFAAGAGSTASGENSFAIGLSNEAAGYNSFVAGASNTSKADRAVVFGQENSASGGNSFIAGYKNGTENLANDAAIFGTNNNAKGRSDFITGWYNRSADYSETDDNTPLRTPQFICGRFNSPNSDAILQVGNGEWNNESIHNYSNAFEVLADGSANLYEGALNVIKQTSNNKATISPTSVTVRHNTDSGDTDFHSISLIGGTNDPYIEFNNGYPNSTAASLHGPKSYNWQTAAFYLPTLEDASGTLLAANGKGQVVTTPIDFSNNSITISPATDSVATKATLYFRTSNSCTFINRYNSNEWTLPSGGGTLLTTSSINAVPEKIEKSVVSSSWSSTSLAADDTQFGKYYYDITLTSNQSSKTIMSVRCLSTQGSSGITLDYAPEIKCNNRKTSSTNLRLYSNTQLEGKFIITLLGTQLPAGLNKVTKTLTATASTWTTSLAAADTQFGNYYTNVTITSGQSVISTRILSNANLTTSPSSSAYYPEVWTDSRMTSATNLRIYSNAMVAGSVTVITM